MDRVTSGAQGHFFSFLEYHPGLRLLHRDFHQVIFVFSCHILPLNVLPLPVLLTRHILTLSYFIVHVGPSRYDLTDVKFILNITRNYGVIRTISEN